MEDYLQHNCKANFEMKQGECVPVKKQISTHKRNYNPFKMWGSWIGFIIIVFVDTYSFFLVRGEYCANNTNILCFPIAVYSIIVGQNSSGFPIFMGILGVFILLPLIGFIIGWGIHSLIRKFKR
jgi:hypothetical protein